MTRVVVVLILAAADGVEGMIAMPVRLDAVDLVVGDIERDLRADDD